MSLCEDTWPEDEASLQVASYRNLCSDYPETPDQNRESFHKDCLRMESFFMRESDGPDLVQRFRAKINELLAQ